MSGALLFGGWLAFGTAAGAALALRVAQVRRRELVARACHEVRGPLTAARLGLHGIEGRPAAAIDLELRRAARALDDLALAPAGRRAADTPERVGVRALLAAEAAAWAPFARAQGRDVRLRWTGPDALVAADPVRLAQAVGNLVANAVEHGGGTVELRGAPAGGLVRVEVSDEGPGLRAPVRELTRGARGGRGARGRGLAIAGEIVRRHGGRLAAAPSARGARLVVELPVLRDDAAAGGLAR